MNEDFEIVQEFLVESYENLDQMDRDLVALEQEPGSQELLSNIFRAIHTLKGTSGFLAFARLERLTHVGESLLSQLRDGERDMDQPTAEALLQMVDAVRALLELIEKTQTDVGPVDIDAPMAALLEILHGGSSSQEAGEDSGGRASGPALDEPETISAPQPDAPQPDEWDEEDAATESDDSQSEVKATGDGESRSSVQDSSIRVDVKLLDSLVQMVGELVLTRNQILQKASEIDDPEIVRSLQRLDLVASELQEGVMQTRMQPIGQVWSKMPRIVRDLSHQLGCKANLVMEGHETELDRTLLEALKGPLTHLVRNSLDHGLEPPEERVAAGKPSEGTLVLRAFHESGQVVIEISDDGQGIDVERIASVALARGVVSAEQLRRMENREILDLVFEAGFSTADVVTNVSGRGVGMDVVRTNIEGIGGSVDLTSTVGVGTTVRVRIPLTLAIIPALIVAERGERYAIPQSSLVELVRLEGDELQRDVEALAGAQVLRLRGRLLPLVHLCEALGLVTHELAHPEAGGVETASPPVYLGGDAEALTIAVLQSDDVQIGLVVEEVHDTQEVVVKPIGRQLKGLPMYAGATIMGDGRVALILDVGGIAEDAGVDPALYAAEEVVVDDAEPSATLLVVEVAGQRAAMPLDDVVRLEEISVRLVEVSGSQEVVQYRDGILPLVRLSDAIGLYSDPHDPSESLSVVVYDGGRHPVGIVVDRVLDVADAELDLSATGRRAGVLGSVVVKGRVTDLTDLDMVAEMAGVRSVLAPEPFSLGDFGGSE